MNRSENSLGSLGSAARRHSSSSTRKMSNFDLIRPKNGDNMAIDMVKSDSHRSTSASISPSFIRPTKPRRTVTFSPAVNMTCILVEPSDTSKLFYNESEIKSMKADAMDQTKFALRHSLHHECNTSPGSTITYLAGRPGAESAASRIPRSVSVAGEIHTTCSSLSPDPKELRYQKLLAEIDREYKIDSIQRRRSMRLRHNHYCAVLDELDRQEDEGINDLSELAEVCAKLSKVALADATKVAKNEATIAKAVLLEERLKAAIRL
mmetsp:Transcript_29632/g.59047  ORF Transcript_29632/g.59047 Transcript_29632/m.59047 type:complete len:264 (+) Transcript_29632:157-948(+)